MVEKQYRRGPVEGEQQGRLQPRSMLSNIKERKGFMWKQQELKGEKRKVTWKDKLSGWKEKKE